MQTFLLLLENNEIQPWVGADDLCRLGLICHGLYHHIHRPEFWSRELCHTMDRVLQNTSIVSKEPLNGEHVFYSYIGQENAWECFQRGNIKMNLAYLDFERKWPQTLWQRFMLYTGLGSREEPSVSCFYVSSDTCVQRVTECYYFEVTLLHVSSKGPEGSGEPRPALSVGLCTDADRLFENEWLVGWTPESIGFHTDDRTIRRNNRVFRKFEGPPFREGDVIGCGWQKYLGIWMVFFTQNGHLVFRRPTRFGVDSVMAAVVYDENAGFQFDTNFGKSPFRYPLKN